MALRVKIVTKLWRNLPFLEQKKALKNQNTNRHRKSGKERRLTETLPLTIYDLLRPRKAGSSILERSANPAAKRDKLII